MHFQVDLADPVLQTLLHIAHGLVVDQRADLFEKKAQQSARSNVADALVVVNLEVTLDGGHGLLACFALEF